MSGYQTTQRLLFFAQHQLSAFYMVRQFLEGGFFNVCGSYVHADAVFCPFCGSSVSDASEDKKIPKKQDRGRAGILDSAFSRASARPVSCEISFTGLVILPEQKATES